MHKTVFIFLFIFLNFIYASVLPKRTNVDMKENNNSKATNVEFDLLELDSYFKWLGIDGNNSTKIDDTLGVSSFGYKYDHLNTNIGFGIAGFLSKELGIDYKFTALHRYFQLLGVDFDYSFALAEFGYKGESYNIDIGFSLADYLNTTKEINNISVTLWDEAYKVKIGKFVTRVGVMDYLTSFEIFNPIRYTFYNDENKNISRYANEMLEANLYIEDDSKLTFYIQKYDDELNDLFYMGNYAMFNNFIPFLLYSVENSDISLIAQEVFTPLYYDYTKPTLEPFAGNAYDMLSPDIKNSTLGMNFLLNLDNFTIGAVWLNSYYKIPLLKPAEELLEDLQNVLEKDKESFIKNYFNKNNMNDMLEHIRYNKVGIYCETSINDFGLRSELSYADKTPILNELSSQSSLALGFDYKGFKMYNSLELKANYLSILDEAFYQGIWVTESDPIHLDFFDLDLIDLSSLTLHLDHSFYYVRYDNYDYYFSKPSLALHYRNMEFTLEYYYSSDYAIVEDSFIWLFRISY